MDLTTPTPAVVPKAAATLILVRDGAAGPEVLMLKRHGLSDVLGEAHVFPGGKVDADDISDQALALIEESPDRLRLRLAEPACDDRTAAALFVAAIREAVEESSILMALNAGPAEAEAALARLRAGTPFMRVLEDLRITLATSQLLPWSRWITPNRPELQRKRFDARFFVARAPADAAALHDGHETTEAVWMNARQALERNWAREISLAPPQIMTLVHLARYADVEGILREARSRSPFLIEPHLADTPEGTWLCYPGDPLHPVRDRVMPGPLRFGVRDKRYEPVGGFEAFFTS